MMDTYETQIFKFFSEQKNFENMIKVASHYEFMKRTLLSEFWEKVNEQLQDLNKANGGQWVIRFSGNGDIFVGTTKLMIYKTSWLKNELIPPVCIAFERMASNSYPFYGIWVDMYSTVINVQAVIDYAKSLAGKTKFEHKEDAWWPLWKESGINFSIETDYIKLLPENRKELIDSYANTLFNLANELETDLDKMATMLK